jgi:hypothetical protein
MNLNLDKDTEKQVRTKEGPILRSNSPDSSMLAMSNGNSVSPSASPKFMQGMAVGQDKPADNKQAASGASAGGGM